MGIRKAQTSSMFSAGPCTAPNQLWWRLRYVAQLQCWFGFAHKVSFEVQVRLRNWANKLGKGTLWPQFRCKYSTFMWNEMQKRQKNDEINKKGTMRTALWYKIGFWTKIKKLSVYADCFGRTTSKTLLAIHPDARRMVSHNHRWLYVFHIAECFVIADHILPTKINKD